MKIMTFVYTKTDGKVSNRVLIPIHVPYDSYFGIDITELEGVDQAAMALEMDAIEETRNLAVKELMKKYDVSNNYRKFLAEKMTELEIEEF